MKLLTLFFSFYILFLTALPCAEMTEKDHMHNAPISQNSNNHDNCNECSPFCTCNCCATPMVCQMETVHLQISILVLKHETSYPIPHITQRSGDIWQPPQLV